MPQVAAGDPGRRPAGATTAEGRGGAAEHEAQCDEPELEEDDAPAPAPEELRRRWAEEVAVVKQLSRQGLPQGHPALVAAVAARDAAEAAWRSSKSPAPASTRLRWAQDKLARALELAEATQAAIDKAEADHERLMVELHDRRADDAERVRKRQQAVKELQYEIGGGLPAAAQTGDGGAAAVLAACGNLCDTVGPEISALAERLPVGSDEWLAANKVLAALAESQRRVEELAGVHEAGGHPEAYDIGDDEDGGGGGDDMSQWSESHDVPGQGGAVEGASQGGPNGGTGNVDDGVADAGGEAAGGGWNSWSHAQWRAPHWQADQHGRWRRASWADQWEAEHGPSTAWATGQSACATQLARHDVDGRDDDEPREPSAKHRRQQAPVGAMEIDGTTAPAAGDDAAAKTRALATGATACTPPAGQEGSASVARPEASDVP